MTDNDFLFVDDVKITDVVDKLHQLNPSRFRAPDNGTIIWEKFDKAFRLSRYNKYLDHFLDITWNGLQWMDEDLQMFKTAFEQAGVLTIKKDCQPSFPDYEDWVSRGDLCILSTKISSIIASYLFHDKSCDFFTPTAIRMFWKTNFINSRIHVYSCYIRLVCNNNHLIIDNNHVEIKGVNNLRYSYDYNKQLLSIDDFRYNICLVYNGTWQALYGDLSVIKPYRIPANNELPYMNDQIIHDMDPLGYFGLANIFKPIVSSMYENSYAKYALDIEEQRHKDDQKLILQMFED